MVSTGASFEGKGRSLNVDGCEERSEQASEDGQLVDEVLKRTERREEGGDGVGDVLSNCTRSTSQLPAAVSCHVCWWRLKLLTGNNVDVRNPTLLEGETRFGRVDVVVNGL